MSSSVTTVRLYWRRGMPLLCLVGVLAVGWNAVACDIDKESTNTASITLGMQSRSGELLPALYICMFALWIDVYVLVLSDLEQCAV
jgi:hypothetical protein